VGKTLEPARHAALPALTLVVGSPDAVARAEGRPVQERLRNAVDLAGYVRALSGQGSADTLAAACWVQRMGWLTS